MKVVKGNVWRKAHVLFDYICIPTNIGWKRNGQNVMGAGLALQAAQRYPDLATDYGEMCKIYGSDTPVLHIRPRSPKFPSRNLLMCPTKPLLQEAPHLSWKQPADLTTVARTLNDLAQFRPHHDRGKVWLTHLGCGNGGLSRPIVRALIDKILGEIPHFILCDIK